MSRSSVKKKKKSFIRPSHLSFIQSMLYVVMSVIVAAILYQTGAFHQILSSFHEFGYIGVFLAGMFFVSIFTAAPAAVVLLTFAESLPILLVALIGGVGSVMGDALILSVISDKIDNSISIMSNENGIRKVIKLLRHTKYKFFLSIIGAIVVASPLPDELGLTLMGISKIKPLTFIILSFILNTFGIWLLLSLLL